MSTDSSTILPPGSGVREYAFRLTPGRDLKQELFAFARKERLQATAILTCVGSLTEVCLRFANRSEPTVRHGHFEIVSLVGTLGETGGHLHLAVADDTGALFGGHVLDGCRIFTTAEVVVADLTGLHFDRSINTISGYRELAVTPR